MGPHLPHPTAAAVETANLLRHVSGSKPSCHHFVHHPVDHTDVGFHPILNNSPYDLG